MIFLTNDSRRISRTEVKRKIRSKSSVGILSISDWEFETDMALQAALWAASATADVEAA